MCLAAAFLSAQIVSFGMFSPPAELNHPGGEPRGSAEQPGNTPPADEARGRPWESCQSATLSADGRWFACTISAGSERGHMLVRDTDGLRRQWEVAGGSEPAFAADSKTLIYTSVSPAGFEYVVRDIETWTTKRSFRSPSRVVATPDARYLVIKGPPGMTTRDAGKPPPGADELLIYSLVDDRITQVGSTSLYEVSGDGLFIAFARAEAGGRASLDVLRIGETEPRRVLEIRGEVSSLSWGDDHRSLALVVVQDFAAEKTVDLLVAVDDATAKSPRVRSFAPADHLGWPEGGYLDPSAPRVGAAIYFYVRDGAVAVPRRPREGDVEIHRSADPVVYDAMTDSLLEGATGSHCWTFAWTPEDGSMVKVAEEGQTPVIPLPGGRAVLVPRRGSVPRYADFPPAEWDLITPGIRSPMSLATGPVTGVSPSRTGRYVAYLDGGHWWAYDTRDGSSRQLSVGLTPAFEADLAMGRGAGGPVRALDWLDDDRGVIAHDRFDAWLLHPDGAASRRLTRGRERDRVYRLAAIDEGRHDAAGGAFYFHVIETGSKHSGYARVGADGVETMLAFGPWAFDRFIKARDAECFIVQRESYDTPPNLFASTVRGDELLPMTRMNEGKGPFTQARRELIAFQDRRGTTLQGTLIYPVGHDSSKRYPMVVSIYGLLSHDHFRFHRPSPDLFDDPATHASRGYFVLLPDIVHQKGEVGPSALDCVESAVRAVIRRDLVDPGRIGLMGISFGGYETAYVLCGSKLFAAGVAVNPPADPATSFLTDRLGNVHSEALWFRTIGMPVPFWEAPESYVRNSVLYQGHGITTPLMIGIGRQDPVVDCRQGESIFNLLRYLKKPAYLMAYPRGGHGLGEHFSRHVVQFFAHYLKGEPPSDWITGNDHR
jgi:dipeptidyl aminopeptidase/acylaminoacyl peptidase